MIQRKTACIAVFELNAWSLTYSDLFGRAMEQSDRLEDCSNNECLDGTV